MGKLVTWVDTSAERSDLWRALCPPNEYRLVAPADMPGIIPRGLIDKVDSVLVVASGTPYGAISYMANVHRIDGRQRAVDQEPFGIAFLGGSPTVSGCLIHHGGWLDRTVFPPETFWQALHASGLGHCTPFSEVPRRPAGPLSALRVTSQLGAFERTVREMKRFVDELRAPVVHHC